MAFNTKEILNFWKSNIFKIHAGDRVKSIPRILAERKEDSLVQKERQERARLVRVSPAVCRRARI